MTRRSDDANELMLSRMQRPLASLLTDLGTLRTAEKISLQTQEIYRHGGTTDVPRPARPWRPKGKLEEISGEVGISARKVQKRLTSPLVLSS